VDIFVLYVLISIFLEQFHVSCFVSTNDVCIIVQANHIATLTHFILKPYET